MMLGGIGWVNHVFASATVTSATNSQGGWGHAYLKSPALSLAWKGAATDLDESITADLGSAKSIQVVGAIATNFTDTVERRILLDDEATFASPFLHDSTLAAAYDLNLAPLLTSHHPAGRSLIYLLPAAVSARYVRAQFVESSNPDGELRVAVYWAGPLWRPAVGFSFDWTREDVEVAGVGALRTHRLRFPVLTPGERVALESIWRDRITLGRILVVPRQEVDVLHHDAIYGRFAGPPRFTPRETRTESWEATLEVTEVLD